MKKYCFIISVFVFLFLSCKKESAQMEEIVNYGLCIARQQALLLAEELLNEKELLPKTTDENGKLVTSDSHWWTSGFFPGVLWYLYEDSNELLIRQYAEDYTKRVTDQQYTTDNHDIGFILFCSFGNGYRLTGNEEYKKILYQGAESLSSRYNPNIGLIRSWDHTTDRWQYPVIIDNMMNLELLEWVAKDSDEKRYAEIASTHAKVTRKHHFRPDYSCYHVVSYDPQTGIPEKKNTHQGLSDESSWARGQAWALYGYTMMYRETEHHCFLEHAKNIAEFIMNHPNLPEDKIPYWDFSVPDTPKSQRDASAGAIMASAFLELSQLTDGYFSKKCLKTAQTQIRTLTSIEYLAIPKTNGNFILKHSVGNMPKGREVDVPLTYADYYYVEALIRYKKWILS